MENSRSDATLALEVRSVEQLLDADGSPLPDPRIHHDAAQAIRAEALQHKPLARFHIVVTVPPGDLAREAEVQAAIRHHFAQEAEAEQQELAEIFRDARQSLAIGIVLATLLLAASEVLLNLAARPLAEAIGRALIVLAWVALWHPAEAFLYTPLPVRRRRRLAESLARATVALRSQ